MNTPAPSSQPPPAAAATGLADSTRSSTSARWARRWQQLRHHPWHGHAVALLLFGLALGSRFALQDLFPPGYPFLTFFPAIVVASFLGGRGPGALCALLSVLASWYWFIPPANSFSLPGSSWIAVAFFTAISALDVLVIDAVLRNAEALEAERARTAALLAQRNTLFSELQHRVSNNLAMVGAVLGGQQRRLAHNPEAVEALKEARARFDLLASVHRKLHNPALVAGDFATLLADLAHDTLRSSERPIALRTEIAALPLNFEARSALALLVVELVTNAVKHAFDGQPTDELTIRLQPDADGGYTLIVKDTGRGLPEGYRPADSQRLGMRIMNALVQGLGGQLATDSGLQGSTFTLRVPAAAALAQAPA